MLSFQEQLVAYRQAIDTDITAYAAHVRRSTQEQYGGYGALITNTFLDMLERGGKRLRGTLALAGYEMCGGQDRTMIVRAATALEMAHASWLVLDDIQDRSPLRRGAPTAHEKLAAYHRRHKLKDSAAHAGVSLAINAAIAGGQSALVLLGGLSVPADLRSKAMGIVAQALTVTAYGQTYDIMNELTPRPRLEDIERTLELKTAYYTTLNPLCTGMVLANAGCADTDAIRSYAIAAGKAFQIVDDIAGVFGDDAKTGKSAMDDIREGKQTLLTWYALRHATAPDRMFLGRCLGNRELHYNDLAGCRRIIKECGALDYAQQMAEEYVFNATTALGVVASQRNWRNEHTAFLRELAQSFRARTR